MFAGYVQNIYGFILAASFLSCVLLIGGMVYFALKNRHAHEELKTSDRSSALEFWWSCVPFLIFTVAFVWITIAFYQMQNMGRLIPL
jgi:heme/copper-type cytochrome/quinol oxidase subunit 2